jgi:hypothetical protein
VPEGIKHNKWSKIMKKIKQELQNRINDTIAKNTTKGLWQTISPSLQSLTFNLVSECQSPLVVFLAIVSLILFCSSCFIFFIILKALHNSLYKFYSETFPKDFHVQMLLRTWQEFDTLDTAKAYCQKNTRHFDPINLITILCKFE